MNDPQKIVNLTRTRNVALYEAAASRRGQMPVTQISQGKLLYRSIERNKPFTTPRGARTIPPRSSEKTDNRWNGAVQVPFAQGKTQIKQGGLDLSCDRNAALNEAFYYSRFSGGNPARGYIRDSVNGVPFLIEGRSAARSSATALTDLFVERVFYVFKLAHKLPVVNLRATDDNVRSFLRRLEDDAGVKAAQKDLWKADPRVGTLDLVRSILMPDDKAYPITRSIGIAALEKDSTTGLISESVRNEIVRGIDTRGNAVLSGADGKELSVLDPISELDVGRGNDGRDYIYPRKLDINQLASSATPDTVIELSGGGETMSTPSSAQSGDGSAQPSAS